MLTAPPRSSSAGVLVRVLPCRCIVESVPGTRCAGLWSQEGRGMAFATCGIVVVRGMKGGAVELTTWLCRESTDDQHLIMAARVDIELLGQCKCVRQSLAMCESQQWTVWHRRAKEHEPEQHLEQEGEEDPSVHAGVVAYIPSVQ